MKASEIRRRFWPYLLGIWLFPIAAVLFLRRGWLDSKLGLIVCSVAYLMCLGASFVPALQHKLSRSDALVYGLGVSLAVWGICVLANSTIAQ